MIETNFKTVRVTSDISTFLVQFPAQYLPLTKQIGNLFQFHPILKKHPIIIRYYQISSKSQNKEKYRGCLELTITNSG